MPNQPEPRPRQKSNPEIEPPPGSPPKRFPAEPKPMAGDDKQAASEKDASKLDDPETSHRLGSGEDPSVESGTDKNDPEQEAAGGDDVEKSFE
jgi:hypothetical protein